MVFKDSCLLIGAQAPVLDFYLNDALVGSAPMPNTLPGFPPCNSMPPPMSVSFDVTPAIAALNEGPEYEFRIQMRGSMPLVGGGLFTFYYIDNALSRVSISGTVDDGGGSGGGGGGGGGGGSTDLSGVISQVQQTEQNVIANDNANATAHTTALDAVRNALGITNDTLQTQASALLGLNSTTAVGFANLSSQLGVNAADLASAIRGNGTAIENVQKSIAEQIILKLDRQGATLDQVKEEFTNNALGTALSIGGRLLSFMTPVGILGVADFVRGSIDKVISGNLRPDRIVKRAVAEFNRGLRRLRRIFRVSASPLTAEDQRMATALADLPGGDDSLAGPDTESEDIFGAYVYFERAYQTLVKGNPSGTSK